MGFFRLIKPDWAKPHLANGEKNPLFVEEIPGPDVLEGYNYSNEYLTEKNNQGYNLYFFPNHPSKDVYAEGTKHLNGKTIDVFNFVFVDMDLKDKVYATKEDFIKKVAQFPLKPTMVVNSGNGVHVYWRITDLTRDSYVIAQLALINYFKTDESVFTVLQLMRLPGYLNTKRHRDYVPAALYEELSGGQSYTYSQLPPEIFSALTEDIIIRGKNHLAKLDGKIKIELPSFVNLDELPDKFLLFIDDPKNDTPKRLFTDPKGFDGDRSRADMRLANILNKAGFNRKEALAVLSNTEKAISRGPHRTYYANLTISKVYDQELQTKYQSVGDKLRGEDTHRKVGAPIRSTWYFDHGVLGEPWRKKEVTGVIAGTGVGKTTVTLKWVKDTIENNPDNDDVHVFISLEMTEQSMVKRWIKLVGENSKLADRLYVVGNEDSAGEPRNIGLQEIIEICNEIKKLTGKNLGTLTIDHIGILARHIDTRKKYTFAVHSEPGAGWADIRMLSLNTVATQMKALAKILDVHVFVLTQTTKGKGQGDLPIDKDGAYGISQYENIMDRIITVWQPLMYVQNQSRCHFLAYQYVKIREKHVNDQIKCYQPRLLTFDMHTGDFRISTTEEFAEFERVLPMAAEARENREKKKSPGYSVQLISSDKLDEVQNLLKQRLQGESNGVPKVQSH